MCNNLLKEDVKLPKAISQIKNSPIAFSPVNAVQKPIMLIITDEYASPYEIYKINNDTTVFNFSKNLKKKGWITKNTFYSNETSTIHSLSSLFNFNLSNTKEYAKQNLINIPPFKLLKNNFYDSIKKKKIALINFGIFDLGNSAPLTNLYNYPKNFLQQFLLFSTFYEININLFTLRKKDSNYLSEVHNKYIFKKINDTIISNNTFLYAHLYMPHAPFVQNPEFKFNETTTTNYISYWNFANQKIWIMLKELTTSPNYRIILTGDHGYRSDKGMDPHNTFTAFYGFEQKDIDKINSVQDLGSLINAYLSTKSINLHTQ